MCRASWLGLFFLSFLLDGVDFVLVVTAVASLTMNLLEKV